MMKMYKVNIFEVQKTKEGVSISPAGYSMRANRFTDKGSVVFLYYPPGTKNQLHSHTDIETVYYVVQGAGQITIGEEIFHAKKGDVFFTPLNTNHQVVSQGEETLIILEVTYKQA